MIKHAIAVLVGYIRKPGRFSVFHYARCPAIRRTFSATSRRVLDIGCGSRRLSSGVIHVDLMRNDCVDVVADAIRLPFKDGSFEGVWMEAVLEHVTEPCRIIHEIVRVLKVDGWLYCEVPFLQGEHSAPGDFRRWTMPGLQQFFKDWQCEWIEPSSGPFSALAYQLRSCLSLLTCFGNDWFYRIMFEAIWGYVVWPIKFLDLLVKNNPNARAHAFGYAIMLRRNPSIDAKSLN